MLPKSELHRKINDLAFTSFIVKTANTHEVVTAPGFFNLVFRQLRVLDQIEIAIENEKEQRYLKFIVASIDAEAKIVKTVLLEDWDLLKEKQV